MTSNENVVEGLLDQARAVLAGESSMSHHRAARAACWIARTALELGVTDILDANRRPCADASMRSKLICLDAVAAAPDPVKIAARAAWAGLSRASHQHAYELAPTVGEVQELLSMVSQVVESGRVSRVRLADNAASLPS